MSRRRKNAALWHIALVCLLWFGAAFVLSSLQSAGRQLPGLFLKGRSDDARFVFADLDGDRKPDLALVETESRRSARTDYSIHIKLSAGPESAVGVNGPMGGLQIAARDVNGDDYLDLIVTSNLDVHFMEVLLNDGRGNFSAATPGEYVRFQTDSQEGLETPAWGQADRTTLANTRSPDDGVVEIPHLCQVSCSGSCRHAGVSHPPEPVSRLRAGRSPPGRVVIS